MAPKITLTSRTTEANRTTLTLGQSPRDKLLANVARIQSVWMRQTFDVTHVHLIAHARGTEGYGIVHSIPLPGRRTETAV